MFVRGSRIRGSFGDLLLGRPANVTVLPCFPCCTAVLKVLHGDLGQDFRLRVLTPGLGIFRV